MEKLQTYYDKFAEWMLSFLTSQDTYIQLAILATVFIISAAIFKLVKSRTSSKIDRLRIPYRFKQILQNLVLLIFPVLALILLLPADILSKENVINFDFTIGSAIMSLLLAWVLSRVLVQFIENNALRNFTATIIWVIAALHILGVLDATTSALDSAGMTVGELRISALTVTKGILAIFVMMYIANVLTALIEKKVTQIEGLSRASKVLLTKIIRIALIVVAILVGITTAGIDLSLLAVFSGALGIGIGFGLQKGISNLFSGMMLLIDKSIKPGDVIELPNGAFGWIAHMGGRYTEIITRDNKSYLIPNEDFITQQVVNWSHGSSLIRIDVKFGVSYKSDPHEVKALAEEVATRPTRVVDNPPPICHLTEFGDSSLNFSLRMWITDAEEGLTNIRGEVMLHLWDVFKENDIQIPFPHREVFMHNADKPVKKTPAKKIKEKEKSE